MSVIFSVDTLDYATAGHSLTFSLAAIMSSSLIVNLKSCLVPPFAHVARSHNVLSYDSVPRNSAFFGKCAVIKVFLVLC